MKNLTTDDMINQLRRRKVPYDYELDDSIDYAISCIKERDSLESTARKYRKLKAEYEARLKADKIAMFEELLTELEGLDYFDGEEPAIITQELMDEVKNWEHGIKDCKTLIKQRIDKLKGEENDGKTS